MYFHWEKLCFWSRCSCEEEHSFKPGYEKLKIPATTIIAEAGVNHNGSIDIAKKLIDVATDSGADFVKFQTFKTEALVTRTANIAKYQKDLTETGKSQFNLLKKLELNRVEHEKLMQHCEKKVSAFFPRHLIMRVLIYWLN